MFQWQIDLPDEQNARDPYGDVVVNTRPSFANGGARAYYGAIVLGGDPNDYHSYLYAVDLTGSLGTTACGPAVPNSTGASARIAATGSASAADRDLRLVAADLPRFVFGYFLAAQQTGFVAMPGGSQGNLCLGTPIGRFASQVRTSAAAGSFSIEVDTTAIPVTPVHNVSAGEQWNFQAWYRDGATSNFTDRVEVIFE